MNNTAEIQRIAEHNDLFRSQAGLPVCNPPVPGWSCQTAGIDALTLDQRRTILARVRNYDDFIEDDDLPNARDYGAFTLPGAGKIFWRIEYYDPTLTKDSDDPANPENTSRVLTIKLMGESF